MAWQPPGHTSESLKPLQLFLLSDGRCAHLDATRCKHVRLRVKRPAKRYELKLIVQIPYFNEEGTLGRPLADIPRANEGVNEVEILVGDRRT